MYKLILGAKLIIQKKKIYIGDNINELQFLS